MFRRGLLVFLSILVTLGIFAASRAESVSQLNTFPTLVTVQRSANFRAGPGTEYAIAGSAKPGQIFYL